MYVRAHTHTHCTPVSGIPIGCYGTRLSEPSGISCDSGTVPSTAPQRVAATISRNAQASWLTSRHVTDLKLSLCSLTHGRVNLGVTSGDKSCRY